MYNQVEYGDAFPSIGRSYQNLIQINDELENHKHSTKQADDYNHELSSERLHMDRPYKPHIAGAYSKHHPYDHDQTIERCRLAEVPLVQISQAVIYDLTCKNKISHEIDVLTHTLSNQSILNSLRLEMDNIEFEVTSLENKLNEELLKSRAYYESYVQCLFNKNGQNIVVDAIVLPSNIQNMLSINTNKLLKETNSLLTTGQIDNDISNNGDPAICLKYLSESKNTIAKYADEIFHLKSKKLEVLSNLVNEQGKAMLEMQKNPSHELSGEEIWENYKMSVLDW
jgi:hypothetical protein